MNNTLKTSVAASFALLVSFTMLLVYLTYATGNPVDVGNEKFSVVAADSGEKRVFLLGSSYVERLNASYIKQYLSENGLQQFHVYNIAKNGAGNPSQQIQFLEPIVSAHPTVLVYGLGFRELGYKPYTTSIPNCATGGTSPFEAGNKTSFSTPSIQDAATYVQKLVPMPDYVSNLADPKHVTVDLLKSYFAENATSANAVNVVDSGTVDKSLFEKREPIFVDIKSLDEINKPLGYTVHVCPADMNNELSTLSEMVSVFKKNNINVILYVPPFSHSYLNAVGNDGIHTFLSTLQKFASENNLQLYDLHDKYVDLNIWADAQHVAENPKVTVYSNDIAQIILKESKSYSSMRTVDTSASNLAYKDLSHADLRSVDLSGKNMTGANLAYSNLYGAKISGTILKRADLSYAYLHNLDLSGIDLSGTILTGADLTSANLKNADLSGKDLIGVNLSGIDLSSTDLDNTTLVRANLAHSKLKGIDLSGKDLTGVNLSGVDLSHTDLDGAILTGATLDNSDLRNNDLTDKNLTGTSLKGVYLSGKDLTGTILVGANLAYANLQGDDLTGKNLTDTFLFRTNFINADLSGADLSGVDLRKTILTGTNLDNVKLRHADLSENELAGTQMVGTDLQNAVIPGVNLANKDLTGTILVGVNMARANLTGVDLSGKDLSGANLRNVNLDHAILTGINLGMKNLTGASFKGADLTRTNLAKAKLVGVNLSGANLSHCDLRYALIQNSNLSGADLSGANLSGATLSSDDLTRTVVAGTNMNDTQLNGIDLSKTVTVSTIKPTRTPGSMPAEIIDNFQPGDSWIKQSSSGNQFYDKIDFVKGVQSLKLVTKGDGSPTVTHSHIFSPTLDLRDHNVSALIKVGNTSKVTELWMYFSSDGFKSSWYTFKIPISSQIKSGQWVRVSINPQDSTMSGSPDLSAINRIQIRINDNATGPVTLHVNEISLAKVVSK